MWRSAGYQVLTIGFRQKAKSLKLKAKSKYSYIRVFRFMLSPLGCICVKRSALSVLRFAVFVFALSF
ncbi:hypothetical protein A4R26_21405 [Niastella populi]|uniref:Uncharacterized protein n=1 Tax=Niastella populi TaxID=550983 RepID=A0A1V9FM98_9BACT|nr:hypothetical protein A4R26_21405 [Niastella populi]